MLCKSQDRLAKKPHALIALLLQSLIPINCFFLELMVLMNHPRETSGQRSARQERLRWEHQKALAQVKASIITALEYFMVS